MTLFQIGDLVKEKRSQIRKDPEKTIGIVTKAVRLHPNGPNTKECQSLKVYWVNYGEFWTTSLRLDRIAKAQTITTEIKSGDMVRLRMSDWLGIVVEKREKSCYIYWNNGTSRWETESVLRLMARC